MAAQPPCVCRHLPSRRGPRGSPRTQKMVREGTWSEGRASGGRTPSVPGGRQGRVPPGTHICGAATETQGPLGPSPSVPCPGSSGGPPALRAPAAPHSPPWPGTAQLPGSCRPAASPGVAQFVLCLTQGRPALSLTLSQLWRRSPRPPERGPGTRVRRASPWLQGEGGGHALPPLPEGVLGVWPGSSESPRAKFNPQGWELVGRHWLPRPEARQRPPLSSIFPPLSHPHLLTGLPGVPSTYTTFTQILASGQPLEELEFGPG